MRTTGSTSSTPTCWASPSTSPVPTSRRPAPQPPAPMVRVYAVSPERDHLEIQFPNITAYRVELPDEKLNAKFGEDSILRLTTELTGPTRTLNQGIIGEGASLTVEKTERTHGRKRIEFELTAHVLQHHLRDPGESVKTHLFSQLQVVVRQWLDQCLECGRDTHPAQVLYREIADMAGQRIKAAIASAIQSRQEDAERRIKAVAAPYNPLGSTQHVNFTTRKAQPNAKFHRELIETSPDKCHINRAVCDDGWEARFCRIIDSHDQVISYVKNHGLGLEVPYRMGSLARTYLPDFIIQIDDGHSPDDPLKPHSRGEGLPRRGRHSQS